MAQEHGVTEDEVASIIELGWSFLIWQRYIDDADWDSIWQLMKRREELAAFGKEGVLRIVQGMNDGTWYEQERQKRCEELFAMRGPIFTRWFSRDCDLNESIWYRKFDNGTELLEYENTRMEAAEGPVNWTTVDASEYHERTFAGSRDRILEAFENGNGRRATV